MRAGALAIPILVLAATGAPGQPNQVELSSVKVEASNEWLVATLKFAGAPPEFKTNALERPDRFEIVLLKTKIADKALENGGSVKKFPLWKIAPYQGAQNASLSFHTGYHCEALVKTNGSTIAVAFPRQTIYTRDIEIGGGALWRTEAKENVNRPIRYDWIEIPPSAQVRLKVKSAMSVDRARRTLPLEQICRQTGALAGINAGYFNGQGFPVSTLLEDSVLVTTGRYATRPMVLLTKEKGLRIGRFTVRPELVFDGKFIPLNGLNTELGQSSTVIYSWNYPFDLIPLDGFLYRLDGGRLTPVSGGIDELMRPDQYYVATNLIPEANPLSQIPKDAPVSLRSRVYERESGNLIDVIDAVGGAPMLVANGQPNVTIAEDFVREDITKNPRARTAIGVKGDGTVILVVVCELQDGFYKGLKLDELANWLIRKGAVTAMNLDGGGSSQLAVGGTLVTPYGGEPRKLSNALLVLPAG